MTGSHKVVLLACGSYNPPTNMHLRMFGKFIILQTMSRYFVLLDVVCSIFYFAKTCFRKLYIERWKLLTN